MSGSETTGAGQTVQSVERAFEILDALGDGSTYGVSEIADGLDLPTSTAHVYLKTLARTGYVVQDGPKYRLGYRFLRRGGIVQRRSELFRTARPYLQRLSADVSEFFTVALGVHENGQRVLLDRYDGSESPFRALAIGQYAYMHRTATGKVLLAGMSDEQVDEVIDEHGLPEITPHTITNRAELFEELSDVRDRGYAVDWGEAMGEQRAVAVPVRDEEKRTIGSVSIGGPSPQIDDSEIEALVKKLQDTVALVEITYQR